VKIFSGSCEAADNIPHHLLSRKKDLFPEASSLMNIFFKIRMGGMGCSSATPAAEGVPHGGMGGARTDGGHPMTGPIIKKSTVFTGKVFVSSFILRFFCF
jgi:hypothetical protein